MEWKGLKLENDYHTIIRKNLMTKIHLEKSLEINYRLIDIVRIYLKRDQIGNCMKKCELTRMAVHPKSFAALILSLLSSRKMHSHGEIEEGIRD